MSVYINYAPSACSKPGGNMQKHGYLWCFNMGISGVLMAVATSSAAYRWIL